MTAPRPIKLGANLDFLNNTTGQNVPNPVNSGDLANKSYVDSLIQALESQTEGYFTYEQIDCSGNPDYPAAPFGRAYIVEVEGKIGGTNGVEVGKGDTIRYLGQYDVNGALILDGNGNPVPSPGGNHATVGTQFLITEGNVLKATNNTAGTVKVATDQQAINGLLTDTAVTPQSLKAALDNLVQTQLEYEITIGNGTDNEFTITHPLGTRAVSIVVQEISTGEIWWVHKAAPSNSTVYLNFATPPTTGQFKVYIKR